MSYTAEPKQQDTNIKVPLISKIAYGMDRVNDILNISTLACVKRKWHAKFLHSLKYIHKFRQCVFHDSRTAKITIL